MSHLGEARQSIDREGKPPAVATLSCGLLIAMYTLESELRITLFTRSRKGMALTREGEALLQYCKGVRDLEGQLLSRIKGENENDEVELVLMGPTSLLSTRIAKACESLHGKFPKLLVHLRADDFTDRVAAVKSGKADLAIVHPDDVPLEMDSKRLKPDRFHLVGAKKWKGREFKSTLRDERIIDFYETDQTTQKYLRARQTSFGERRLDCPQSRTSARRVERANLVSEAANARLPSVPDSCHQLNKPPHGTGTSPVIGAEVMARQTPKSGPQHVLRKSLRLKAPAAE